MKENNEREELSDIWVIPLVGGPGPRFKLRVYQDLISFDVEISLKQLIDLGIDCTRLASIEEDGEGV